jgi:nucleoside-diphosphate-sugar epimerase
LKVLFIGGTGVISTDTVRYALDKGIDVTVLNRGTSGLVPPGVKQIRADIYDTGGISPVLGNENYDTVVDCISYTPEQLLHKLRLFRGKYDQFLFISSTAVYKPGQGGPKKEDAVLGNFGWNYGRDKAACEYELERERVLYGHNYTVVRPCETYNDLRFPGVIVANPYRGGYTIINRLRAGRPVVVHDDGAALCPFLHAKDIAKGITGLLGNRAAYGEAFHITGEELCSWKKVTELGAAAAGAKANIVYIPSRELALAMPMTPHGDTYGVIICSKMISDTGYDNSKIKSLVPEFSQTIALEEGLAWTIKFYDDHPEYKVIDEKLDAGLDRVCALALENEPFHL